MKYQISNLSDRYKVFLFVFFLSIIAILLALFVKDTTTAIIIGCFIGLLFFLGRPLWLSDKHGETRVRILALKIASTAVAAFMGWQLFIEDIVRSLMGESYPNMINQNTEIMAGMSFLFLSLIIYLVIKPSRDNTSLGIHSNSINDIISDGNFDQKLQSICASLGYELDNIDIETNWNSGHFTPLDAEVEVKNKKGLKKKVTDLLSAVKGAEKGVFLVLGSPGSGKSVSLRKLSNELLIETKKTRKIPIYINLREWHPETPWNSQNVPTTKNLRSFILEKLSTITASNFFDEYFDKLYESGHLYFIFDSFDEIPELLDETDGSYMVDIVSDILFKFIKGASHKEPQGILSSRFFRKPTYKFHSKTTLEIRPFSEYKVSLSFEKHGIFNKKIINSLFKDREDLLPIVRNPFTATLIAEYAKNNGNLPPNQSEMYADYFDQTLDRCIKTHPKNLISKAELLEYTVALAGHIFTEYGLEANLQDLIIDLEGIPVTEVVSVLKHAKIVRFSGINNGVISFSHRRFIEYLAVQKIICDGDEVNFSSIPLDTKERDSLVLYCEIVNKSRATEIANYCWSIIEKIDNDQDTQVIHSLRFIRDAFKGRKDCISDFKEELFSYILKRISDTGHVITAKISLETIALLDELEREECVRIALDSHNPILETAALNACRNLRNSSVQIKNTALKNIEKYSSLYIANNYKKTLFPYSLSEAFNSVRFNITLNLILYFSLLLTVLLLSILNQNFFWLSIPFFLITIFSLLLIRNQLINPLKLKKIESFSTLYLIPCLAILLYLHSNELELENIKEVKERLIIHAIDFTTFIENNYISHIIDHCIQKISDFFKYSFSHLIAKYSHYLESYIFILLCLLIILNYSKPRFILLKDSLNNIKFTSSIIIVILWSTGIGIGAGISQISILDYFPKIKTTMSSIDGITPLILLSSIYSLLLISHVVLFTVRRVRFNQEKKDIELHRLNDRHYISQVITRSTSTELENYIIDYIENNVHEAVGTWDDPNILSVGNTSSYEIYARLARIEEKWLKLDR